MGHDLHGTHGRYFRLKWIFDRPRQSRRFHFTVSASPPMFLRESALRSQRRLMFLV